ncbi:Fas-binding factor 1 [Larimichthys crocea]|uniref:Uncharacterized protein n=1 Tax=Larimichthys crocea TaxID=215358 RepID=A0ACD3R691_LARCR|nr:Fas-binding factor 1 [Larimichthys crocea]
MAVLTTIALILRHRFCNKIKPHDRRPELAIISSWVCINSSATDNIFSMLAEEVKRDGGDTEDSDVSAADPDDILKNMKSKKKPSSAPAQTNRLGNEGPKKDSLGSKPEGADESTTRVKKPNSAPSSTAHSYKKFTFSDSEGDDDDEGLGQTPHTEVSKNCLKIISCPMQIQTTPWLIYLMTYFQKKPSLKLNPAVQRAKPGKSAASPAASPILKTETSKTAAKRGDLTFDDDKDDLMDALGFDGDKNYPKKKETALWSNKDNAQMINNFCFSAFEGKLKTKPNNVLQSDVFQLQARLCLSSLPTEYLTSVSLFLCHVISEVSPHRELVLRLDEILESLTSPRLLERPATGELKDQLQSQEKQQQEKTGVKESLLEDDLTFGSYQPTLVSTPEGRQSRRQSVRFSTEDVSSSTPEKKPKPTTPTPIRKRNSADWLGLKTSDDYTFLEVPAASISQTPPEPQSQPQHLPSDRGSKVLRGPSQASDEAPQQLPLFNPVSAMLPGSVWSVPQQSQMQNASTAAQQQVTLSADSLQQLLLQQQQMMQSQLLGPGALQRLKETEQQPGDYQALKARIIQLEGQVKTLQLERDQSQMLLENIQQRHKQDMELVENAHKARVKLLEESAAQRETQARQECEDLMERLATATRSAERERSELQAQYQRKLAQAQQDRDREVERLRDLQRKSILEMKKDHEDQVHRLKKLKDEEIDAVTSATSQTRSLTVVIEQMEQFSSRLGELSSRVESTHEHTAHGLEQGARHRDEQLRLMQDRLAQQQKSMVEERAYLKEIISRMDTQLNEQQRQLEKERWKMTAEQAKAESTQRGLEDERRALSMQINMEREELERAKSALLEEQKTVMQNCAEERRKLAAEWAHFHTLEKQRHERAEREVSSLLEKREGSILSLAQEQADLKLHTAELKQKEMAVAHERETLERLRDELHREKEKISSTALRLETRAHEVEAFSKLAEEKHEEGKQALQEAKRVEAEHEARLTSIHTQTERLRQQEKQILQERMRLSKLQKDTDRLRQDAPITSLPQIIPPLLPDEGSFLPNPEFTSTLDVPPSTLFTSSQSMALQASLALWKYTAEKDREYLQEEQIFLDNLKKKPYRSCLNTD